VLYRKNIELAHDCVQIELQLIKCTSLLQCDVKIWFVDIFEEHEDICMFFGERHVHLIMEKHVMRYLKATIDYETIYISECEIRLQIHNGQAVSQTEKVHPNVALVWDQL
jgi:hypothetical protein